MSRRTGTTTARTDCEHDCGTRVIIARRVPSPDEPRRARGWLPALNWAPDPAGNVAAWHKPSGAHEGYFLARGEELPGPQWHRYAVHECAGTRRHAQRGEWAQAIGDLHAGQRRQRGRRKRVAAEQPGMFRLPGGEG